VSDTGGTAATDVGAPTTGVPDQTVSGVFRALLLVQVAAAGFFGLFPLVAPEAFGTLFGHAAAEPFMYRVAGAATTGYAVVALVAFLRPDWMTFRIPLIATLTFNVAAVTAALLSADEGSLSALIALVFVAASAFAVIAAYWLYRDEGPRGSGEQDIEEGFRATLIAATAVAAFFGVAPLLLTTTFASVFGLHPVGPAAAGGPASDAFVYRLAGAATLGYAVGGVFQLLSGRWAEIRLQVVGAITFNALGAISAAIYLAAGGRSVLGVLVLLAAGFFTLALTWWSARATT
jgi:hypothetical protein